jgi:hypothetical protein
VNRTPRALLPVCLLLALAPARAETGTKTMRERAGGHWAFQPVRRPAVPAVKDRQWVRNPIDAFNLARLEREGLRPNPPANRRTLLRRLHLDLTGLPPTPAEQQAFLEDDSPRTLAGLVERLLASSAHGERYARHWLDVARYADTNGYERDGDKPNAWRYRDWVIDAFNADLPFDRFVLEQIAGDELPGANARTKIATTFLRLGTWDDEPANDAIDRYDQLDDVLGVTCTAFLAQTIRCARCHDHKFEPFPTREYYELLAVFQPLRRPQKGREDLDVLVGTDEELAAYQRHQAMRHQTVYRLMELELYRVLGELSGRRGLRPLIERETVARLRARAEDLERNAAPIPPRAYIWREDGPRAPVTRILRRGIPRQAGKAVEPALPAVLAARQLPGPTPLKHSAGRRLWLAKWIASLDNPLTARVITNRVWQWHLGRGLVATSNDFGLAGEQPTHPELLDWLAAELVQSGWSLKHLHRLIVNSATYQTSSVLFASSRQDQAKLLALYGRWRLRRVEAEVLRDSALAVAGMLNRQAGGPGVYPPLPPAVLATQSLPGLGWGRSDENQSARRSVYVFAKRSLQLPELELLDTPDSTSPCECRPMSTTAPQALTLLNGAFLNEQASRFADRLRREAGAEPAAQVRRAFLLALCRPPRPDEEKLALAFLDRQARQIAMDRRKAGQRPGDARGAALASLCLVLLNSNEFAYPG